MVLIAILAHIVLLWSHKRSGVACRTTTRRLIGEYLRTYATVAQGYGEEEALADYRVQLLSGLMVTLAAIAVLPDNDAVNALIVALLERNCAAARDWESIDAATAAI